MVILGQLGWLSSDTVPLNCCLARGYRYTAVGFQLNDVIALNAIEEYDVIPQITNLREE